MKEPQATMPASSNPASPKGKGGGILHALLPGARIDKNTNKILVHTSTNNETITFNVGGTKFETYRSTLRSLPSSPLSNDAFLEKHFRANHGDYFFDRDPAIFHCVLNFLRTGELHLSSSACGPVVKSELEYWGVDELDIEECCWSRYSNWASTLQALRKLEEDRASMVQFCEYPLKERPSLYRRTCRAVWRFCSDPNSSTAAQWFAYLSLLVIMVSIFSFVVQTHEDFQVTEHYTFRNSSGQDVILNSSSPPSVNSTLDDYYTKTRKVPHESLYIIDQVCLAFLLSELLVRLAVAPAKLRFLTLPVTVIDFLALVPDIVDAVLRLTSPSTYQYDKLTDGLNFLKLLRVMRILRLIRHVPGLWVLFYTLQASAKDLLLLLMFVSVGMLISASLIFYAERGSQDSFSSIPKCMWWALITMTTVGYGDMSPVTAWGYLVGAVTSISGVLMVGFTVPVLVNNFLMYYSHTMSTMQRDKQHSRLPPDDTPSASGTSGFGMLGNFGKTLMGSASEFHVSPPKSNGGSKRASADLEVYGSLLDGKGDAHNGVTKDSNDNDEAGF